MVSLICQRAQEYLWSISQGHGVPLPLKSPKPCTHLNNLLLLLQSLLTLFLKKLLHTLSKTSSLLLPLLLHSLFLSALCHSPQERCLLLTTLCFSFFHQITNVALHFYIVFFLFVFISPLSNNFMCDVCVTGSISINIR